MVSYLGNSFCSFQFPNRIETEANVMAYRGIEYVTGVAMFIAAFWVYDHMRYARGVYSVVVPGGDHGHGSVGYPVADGCTQRAVATVGDTRLGRNAHSWWRIPWRNPREVRGDLPDDGVELRPDAVPICSDGQADCLV